MFINRILFIFTHSVYEACSEFRSGLSVNQTEKSHIPFNNVTKKSRTYFISYFEYMGKNLTAPKQYQMTLEIPRFRWKCHLKSKLICQHCILCDLPWRMLLDHIRHIRQSCDSEIYSYGVQDVFPCSTTVWRLVWAVRKQMVQFGKKRKAPEKKKASIPRTPKSQERSWG